MNRLTETIRNDIRLQHRNGFYWAAGFVACVTVLIIKSLSELDLELIIPALIINNLLIGTFYFIAGLVLLEKKDGSLQALVVTPLLDIEYLASKVITLTLLSILENTLIVVLSYGLNFNMLTMILGISLGSALNCLCGFVAVARFDSINEYLFPSILITTILLLPLLDYFGLWSHPIFYIHPYQAVLVVLKDSFSPVERWQLIYGILYTGAWIACTALWSLRLFGRYVVAREQVS